MLQTASSTKDNDMLAHIEAQFINDGNNCECVCHCGLRGSLTKTRRVHVIIDLLGSFFLPRRQSERSEIYSWVICLAPFLPCATLFGRFPRRTDGGAKKKRKNSILTFLAGFGGSLRLHGNFWVNLFMLGRKRGVKTRLSLCLLWWVDVRTRGKMCWGISA